MPSPTFARGLILAGLVLSGWTHAASTYPDKPITVVIPYAVGSDPDYYTRLMVEKIKPYFNEANLRAENRVGDAGAEAAAAVKLVPADGYTLMAGRVASQAVGPALKPKLPYRWSDFTFLGLLELEPLICAVRSDAPFKDARGLLAAMRKASGTLKFGHTGAGTIVNLGPHYLMKLGGLKAGAAVGVEFASAPEAVVALVNGQIDFSCSNAGVLMEAIHAGKLRPLFTTAAGRLHELPEVRTASEAGFPNMGNIVGWTVLVGPAGMQAPIVARWRQAFAQLSRDPEWNAGLKRRGAIPTLGTANDNAHFVRDQFVLYDRLVLSLGLRE